MEAAEKLEEEEPVPNVPDAEGFFLYKPKRICETCGEGVGCNANLQTIKVTRGELELLQKYEHPVGTHIRILNIANTLLGSSTNPSTGIPFQNADVIPILEGIDHRGEAPVVTTERARLYGIQGRDWVPTDAPVTNGSPEKIAAWRYEMEWQEAIDENRRHEERKRERERQEEIRKSEEVLKDVAPELPPINWEAGESLMRAKVAWRFLKMMGACGGPIDYVRSYPDEALASEVWENTLNGKKSPRGYPVSYYWITRIINYVPGLMKEVLKEMKKGDLDTYNADGHYERAEFRQALLKILPWPKLEHRLRQHGVYKPTRWEVELFNASRITPPAIVAEGIPQQAAPPKKEEEEMAINKDRVVAVSKFVAEQIAPKLGKRLTLEGTPTQQLTATENFIETAANNNGIGWVPVDGTSEQRLDAMEKILEEQAPRLNLTYRRWVRQEARPVADRLAALEAFAAKHGFQA
jgi:hypothetical protein